MDGEAGSVHSASQCTRVHLSIDRKACGHQEAHQQLVSIQSKRAGPPCDVLLLENIAHNPKQPASAVRHLCRAAPAMCGVIALRGM